MKTTTTDVLVIGGGIAGALAAAKAQERGAQVTLVDKTFFGRGGCSALASGAFPHWQEGDEIEPWLDKLGGPLVNYRLLEKAVRLTAELVPLLESWGVRWVRDAGKLLHMPGSTGFTPAVMMEGGGPQMMLAIRAEILRRGISVVDHVMVTDLLTSDGLHPTRGRLVGAVGLGLRSAEPQAFHARATIVCTGPFHLPYAPRGQGYPGMPNNNSGDGQAMMLRTGATMGKLELGGTGIRPYDLHTAPGLEVLLGHGGRFRNADGELYMQRPLVDTGQRRSALGVTTLQEYEAGRGPVYLDVTHFGAYERSLAKRVIPIVMGNLESVGVDVSREWFPYTNGLPASNGVSGAGAKVSESGQTSVAGLWGAGGDTDGAYCTMGQNVGWCAALGWWAGEDAGAHVAELPPPVVNEQVEEEIAARALAPLSRPAGDFPALHTALVELPRALGQAMTATSLSQGLDQLKEIQGELDKCRAQDEHELVKLIATRNATAMMELAMGAMLRREESRGTVLRRDFPFTDNHRWGAWTRCRLVESGELEWWEENLPDSPDFRPLALERVLHPFFSEGPPAGG